MSPALDLHGRACARARAHAGARLPLAALLVLWACALPASDQPAPGVVVKRIERRSELPGGPKQYGDVGDFLLQNDKLMAVILDAGHAVSPALWGGALADLDLVRPELPFRNGQGLEQFFLLLPMVNLNVPHPEAGGVEGLRTPDGRRGIVRVTGRGDRVLALLNMMDMARPLGLVTRFLLRTDYELAEDADYLKITTYFRKIAEERCADGGDDDFDGATDCDDDDCSLDPACPGWCDRLQCPEDARCDPFHAACLPRCGEDGRCETGTCDQASGFCFAGAVAMEDLAAGTDLTDVLTGGLLRLLSGEATEITRKPGYVAGDMALLGANLFSFAPGLGFEIDAQYRLMFLRGRNALLDPLSFDFLAGTGDRVSYGYFSLDGAVLFPFATESLTGSMTHGLSCLLVPDDDAVCDDVAVARFSRYLAVGDGDVASVQEVIYRLRGMPHGRIAGQVLDGRTGRPVSKADVYAIADPCASARCGQVADGCGGFATYGELVAAARACTRTPDNPDGYALVESQYKSDPGVVHHPEGAFAGPLPPGGYYLVARLGKGPLSVPVRVEVRQGQTSRAALLLPAAGRLRYRVLDQAGRPIAARLTVGHCFPECGGREGECPAGQRCDDEQQCRPASGCRTDADCDADERCAEGGRCACALPGRLPGDPREELGDGYLSDRKVAVAVAPEGEGELSLPPGRYDLVFSHGIEYEVDRQEVELAAGTAVLVDARVRRVVDSRGWLSTDQHVHTVGSADSSTPLAERLYSAIADGLEVMAITDHDYVTDPEPLVRQLGLAPRLAAFSGEEVSTLDVSHLIGWPLRSTTARSDHGALAWVGRTPREIFSWLRGHGLVSPEETLVIIAHPRGGMSSYFDVFGLNSFTLQLEPGSVQQSTPLLDPSNFAPEYDLQEVLNSKRLEITRTPTYGEVRAYELAWRRLAAELKDRPREEVLLRLGPPSAAVVREMLARTPEEQQAVRSFAGLPRCVVPPGCRGDADCARVPGTSCALEQGGLCLKPCATTGDGGCTDGLVCQGGFCDVPAQTACDSVKGLTDDWLRLLELGIFKPGIGGSDAHGIANYEIGSLRNYLKSPTDDPLAVELATVVRGHRAGRSFATYGPFVELSVDGQGPGETALRRGRAALPLAGRWRAVVEVWVVHTAAIGAWLEIVARPAEASGEVGEAGAAGEAAPVATVASVAAARRTPSTPPRPMPVDRPRLPGVRYGDMHCHSVHSDGRYPVAVLAERAVALGLDFVALTDHDTTAGHGEIAATLPVTVIPGEELTTFSGHFCLYGLDRCRSWHEQGRRIRTAEALAEARRAGALASLWPTPSTSARRSASAAASSRRACPTAPSTCSSCGPAAGRWAIRRSSKP